MAAPEGNTNSEKWTEDEATEFMTNSYYTIQEKNLDFIGELARDMGQYRDLYTYLVDKFPHLKLMYKKILQECEANCFSHGKKGEINSALAIMNLKSNHGWTDRIDQTTNSKDLNVNIPVNKWIDEDKRS